MADLHFQSATVLARRIREGEITAREALEHFLARVETFNPAVNAIVELDVGGARDRADLADAQRRRGEHLPELHGVPMTVKDSFDVAGMRSTWGVPEMAGNVATADALAVSRLKAAGVNIFGKSNVPLRLSDIQTYNEIYGVTNNPWDASRTPGGSSGGGAAALAAGLTGLEMGSDIGGSIRTPAHFCGVFGHKPTWGLAPPRGHSLSGALAPTDISVIGPLARSADDLEVVMRLIGQPDEPDSNGLRVCLPTLDEPLSALRIGVWRTDAASPVAEEVQGKVDAVAALLAARGASIDDKRRPAFEPRRAFDVYNGLLTSTLASRMADEQFDELVAAAAVLDPGDHGPSATYLRRQTLRLRDWAALNEERARIRWAWRDYFGEIDVLIAPVTPTEAFPHDHSVGRRRTIDVDGRPQDYYDQLFWAALAGLAYLPATTIPVGLGRAGLPVGVQIIGPAFSDLRVIQLAQRLERLGLAFSPPPSLA